MKKLLLLLTTFYALNTNGQNITTLAGNGAAGYGGDGGSAGMAQLNGPFGIAVDNSGNVYVADRFNNAIRKINAAGVITTIAGNNTGGYGGDNGPATAASLSGPTGVSADKKGNIFIADHGNNRVRKVSLGMITTVAGNGSAGFTGDGGPGTNAALNGLRGVASDQYGNIFIADQSNNRVRRLDTAGVISTIAGNGTAGFSGDGAAATAAQLFNPGGVAIDDSGNVFIADVDNSRIRKVSPTGMITTYAGTGTGGFSGDGGQGTAAMLSEPICLSIDKAQKLYIADGWNARIRVIDHSGNIYTVAGNGTAGFSGDGGIATYASLNNPYGIAADTSGNLFIADYSNNRIRRTSAPTGILPTSKSDESISVYPNPSNGQMTISFINGGSGHFAWSIVDVLGKTVAYSIAEKNGTTLVAISQPPGIYFLSACDDINLWRKIILITE